MVIRLLLALLMHSLLGRHGVSALRLLRLEVSLVLDGLLVVGGHVRPRDRAVGHGCLWHCLWDGGWGGVRVFGRLDVGFSVDAISIGGLGGVKAGLE